MNPSATNRLARSCAYSALAPEWEKFVRLVTPVVALSARRVSSSWGDASTSTVHEIIQDVLLKLCEDDRRILREFDDRGNDCFLKLLRVITVSVAIDRFRRMQAEKRGGRNGAISLESENIAASVSDAKATQAVEWPTLMGQLDDMLLQNPRAVSPRDRTLFWLYYRQGLTAEAIARIPAIGLSAKGVESALVRLTRLLRTMIERPRPKTDVSNIELSRI